MSNKKKGKKTDKDSPEEFTINILDIIKFYGKGKYLAKKAVTILLILLAFTLLFVIAYYINQQQSPG